MVYRVPFDHDHLDFELPPGASGWLAAPEPVETIADLKEAVFAALARPLGTPPLREMAKAGHKVCVVFTDATRSSPDHIMVPAILSELEAAGVHDRDVTLLCGLGLHRPSTPEERIAKLGRAVVDRYRVLDHEPQNPEALVDLGVTESGIPLSVSRVAHEADLLVATGIVEPHQYAGYSGGRKTLAIGAAGEAMISHTHGPHMVDHPAVRLGRIEGNPFHEALTEAARRAGLDFILNVVLDDEKRPTAVAAGAPEPAFESLVQKARLLYEVPIPRRFDVAVAGVGYPKDANIYQASRAASYLFFAPTPVVKDGGVIILPAPTPEGAGQGVGEQRFREALSAASDMPSLLNGLRRTGYPPGAQRAFVMAKVLEKCRVIFVGSRTPEEVEKLHMIACPDLPAAFSRAAGLLGKKDLDVLVVPHALLTLPIVTP